MGKDSKTEDRAPDRRSEEPTLLDSPSAASRRETQDASSSSRQRLTDAEMKALIKEILPTQSARLEHREHLASGGMGTVDVVLDLALQRRVARKRISADLHDLEHVVRLFLREAQITGQLDHPAIVPVHDVGVDGRGQLFFTMKLVDGAPLSSLLRKLPKDGSDPESLEKFLDTVVKVCDALDFAHDRGVVHGDIKPANVMVGSFGEVYLMDWGLAHLQEDARSRLSPPLRRPIGRGVQGTPSYMAPEQAAGRTVDKRTDIFLLGALLYAGLAGHPPYRGDSAKQLLADAGSGKCVPLDDPASPARCPNELARIVATAMAFLPEDRYQSVADLRGDLKAFLRGGSEFPRRRVKAGEYVIREGEHGDEVFVVESGRVRVYQEVDGRTVERRELGPGDAFGEMAMLTSSLRTASVVAIEDCVLRIVTADILEREMQGMKPWLAAITRTLARNLLDREKDR